MAAIHALTVTTSNPYLRSDAAGAWKLVLDWSSAAAGTVSLGIGAALKAANPACSDKIRGKLRMVQTIPGLNGDKTTTVPTNLYDITIDDEYGLDVAGGQLADRSNSVAQAFYAIADIFIDGELTLKITNAGDGKKGRIVLFFD